MKESARFYRLLGVDVPDPTGDHNETRLPSGVRLMWDTLELIKQLDPAWTEPAGHRLTLAFECASPAEVDSFHRRVVDAGFRSKAQPWDAFWGPALRAGDRPGRQRSRPLRGAAQPDRLTRG